ncbi:DUF2975 domain-containing protein [Flavobacterium sp.]|uniref:DUF2975 domain-containing protein n=1 Tax=Flavobacterium sp. TaxID=239 RepID=UPI003A95D96C
MSKIKILNWILKGVIFLTALGIAFTLYLYFAIQNSQFVDYSKLIPVYSRYMVVVKGILFLSSMICLQASVNYFIKYNFFNSKSVKHLKYSGILLLIYSLTGIVFIIIKSERSTILEHLNNNIDYITTLIIAIGIFVVGDIIKSGVTIKQENELTI